MITPSGMIPESSDLLARPTPRSVERGRAAIPMMHVKIIQESKERPIMRAGINPLQHLAIHLWSTLSDPLCSARGGAFVVLVQQRFPAEPPNQSPRPAPITSCQIHSREFAAK